MSVFHLAYTVTDLDLARSFYGDLLGCVLEWGEFQKLSERLKSASVTFIIEPHIRYARLLGEQATIFIKDPSANALEFKAYKNASEIFASDNVLV